PGASASAFQRLGSRIVRAFRGRILAATNQDLRQMIKRGTFRDELYQRLARIVIRTPTLREMLRAPRCARSAGVDTAVELARANGPARARRDTCAMGARAPAARGAAGPQGAGPTGAAGPQGPLGPQDPTGNAAPCRPRARRASATVGRRRVTG